MGSKSIGGNWKPVKGKDGKTRLVPDNAARLAKMDVSTRQKALGKAKTKVAYRRGK